MKVEWLTEELEKMNEMEREKGKREKEERKPAAAEGKNERKEKKREEIDGGWFEDDGTYDEAAKEYLDYVMYSPFPSIGFLLLHFSLIEPSPSLSCFTSFSRLPFSSSYSPFPPPLFLFY